MELNSGRIIALPNVLTKAPLEPDGDNKTQVDGIRSETHVEFVLPPTYLPKSYKTNYRYIPVLF